MYSKNSKLNSYEKLPLTSKTSNAICFGISNLFLGSNLTSIMKFIKLLWSRLVAFFSKKKPVHHNPIIAQKRVLPNMKVWECDIATGNIVEAEIMVTPYTDSKGRNRKNRRVMIKKNCIYEYAMNGENATRKFESRILKHLKPNG